MRTRTILTTLGLLPVLTALLLAGGAAAANGGNSANAKLCHEGGWETLTRSDGSSFASAGACVSYAARGGAFGEADPPGPIASLALSECTPEGPEFTCVSITGSGLEPGSSVTLYRAGVAQLTLAAASDGTFALSDVHTSCTSGTSHTFQAAGTAAGGAAVTSDPLVVTCA